MYLWPIQVDVCQKPPHYCKVILQLKNTFFKIGKNDCITSHLPRAHISVLLCISKTCGV